MKLYTLYVYNTHLTANHWRCLSPSVHFDPVSHNTLASFEATLLGTLAILTGWP